MTGLASFAQVASVQVVHNSADLAASTVDVYVNGVITLDDFAFRTASPFVDLPAGTEISLAVAPGNSTSVADALLTVPVTLTPNETYIVVAYGIVSATGYSPAPPLSLEIFPMARETSSDPDSVDILAFHGSTDAPTVDAVETGAGAGTLFDDISTSEFQGYITVPEADYNVEVRLADGVTQVAGYSVPLETLNLGGSAVTVFASGFLDPSQNSNGPAFGLWVSTPAGGPLLELPAGFLESIARVQVVHNSADLAASIVDVYIDGVNTLDDLAFRSASPFVSLPAGVEISLAVAPGNSTSVADALLTVPVTLAQNETYIVVAYGIVSATGYSPAPPLSLEIFPMAKEAAADPASVDILVHHGATDAPTVDVYETGVGAGRLVDNISPSEFQGYLTVPEADYNLEVRLADGTTQVAGYSAPLQTLGLAGSAITVFASGFLDPSQNSNGPAFGLWVSTAAGGNLLELPAGVLGVDEQLANSFVVYPNPTSNELRIEGITLDTFSYNVVDIQGRVVLKNSFELNGNTINTSKLNSGVYFLNILDKNKIISTKKIIKD